MSEKGREGGREGGREATDNLTQIVSVHDPVTWRTRVSVESLSVLSGICATRHADSM